LSEADSRTFPLQTVRTYSHRAATSMSTPGLEGPVYAVQRSMCQPGLEAPSLDLSTGLGTGLLVSPAKLCTWSPARPAWPSTWGRPQGP
jgi:hypothetical protein